MRGIRYLFIIAVLLTSIMLGSILNLNIVNAETPSDFPVEQGHFFTQGRTISTAGEGFAITDEEGIPFWDFYKKFGGAANLGYPISDRFIWHDKICQILEFGVMCWDAPQSKVTLANGMDILSQYGLDEWLEREKMIPRPANIEIAPGSSWDQIFAAHMSLLDDSTRIRTYYTGSVVRQAYLGLPISKVEDMGTMYVARFQRGAIRVLKSNGELKEIETGSFIKESGILGEAPFKSYSKDYDPIKLAGVPVHVSMQPTGVVYEGLATYYADDWHGIVMRNGEYYDMYDPTTTACNIFPLESWLKVTNQQNGRFVIVRVTNTGGFNNPILVDLSYGAFGLIDDHKRGIIPVTVELLQ